MKTMTCRQLGGACDIVFQAETFEEMAEMSKKHGMEMFQLKNKPHLTAMQKMQQLLNSPEKMNQWFEAKRTEFETQNNS